MYSNDTKQYLTRSASGHSYECLPHKGGSDVASRTESQKTQQLFEF